MLKIYVASSWRNTLYPSVLAALRAAGHEVYDFRAGGRTPANIFDPERTSWSLTDYAAALASAAAAQQFAADKTALDACDVVVLLLPCGCDAHIEAGYARGRGTPVIVYLGEGFAPGLMHKLCDEFVADIPGLLASLSRIVPRNAAAIGDTPPALRSHPLSRHANTEVSDHG